MDFDMDAISLTLGVSVGLVIVATSWIVTTLAMDSPPTQGINLVQVGFFLKLVLSAILSVIAIKSIPEINLLEYGLSFGLVVCVSIPVVAIIKTRTND